MLNVLFKSVIDQDSASESGHCNALRHIDKMR